jgi:hypothetical protein
MEADNSLFELGREIHLPIWDIVRYSVYLKYYYPQEDRENLSIAISHPFSHIFYLTINVFLFLFKMFFLKGENIVISHSRYINSKGEYFDKSALSIIETLGSNCLVFEPLLGKKSAYSFIYDFCFVFRMFFISKKFPLEYYSRINEVLINNLGENLISYEEIKKLYHNFNSDHLFYKLIFSFMKIKKLFISTGNPKGILLAAKDLGIITYLLQHASIEFDEVDYSYCSGISTYSNILFPDYLLTFGEYWCKNINVPAKGIIPIGNDFFYSKPNTPCDNSILIISSIIHGRELSILTKQLANLMHDQKFVFKLHPREFHLCNKYIDFFKENTNVIVMTNQTDTNLLIAKSQLVVLIVSAVLYEALNQNKKVAVYKKVNYRRQESLANFHNIYFFDYPAEIFNILQKVAIPSEVEFYKPTDYVVLKKILNIA